MIKPTVTLRGVSVAMVLAAAAGCAMADNVYWYTDFKGGKVPSDLTMHDPEGPRPIDYLYRHVDVDRSWVSGIWDGRYAILAPSHSRSPQAVSRTFSLPPVYVASENALLRWEAVSVLPGFAETYRVIASCGGADEVLYECGGENDSLTMRSVSLGQFAGREVTVSFECTSADRYLLGVTSLWVGEPEAPLCHASGRTGYYTANGSPVTLTADVSTAWARFSPVELRLDLSDGRQYPLSHIPADGMPAAVEWSIDVADDAQTDFTIAYKALDKWEPLLEGSVWSSGFKRMLLVDEGTGMWCNTCPGGVLEIQALQRRFGSGAAVVATHVRDPYAQDGYWSGLQFYAVPYFMLDRMPDTKFGSTRMFGQAYGNPVRAGIELTSATETDAGRLAVGGKCTLADPVPPAGVKIGYVVTRDFSFDTYDKEYYQENSTTVASSLQYYYLPTRIPSDLLVFSDVNIDGTYGFSGVMEILPEALDSNRSADFSFEIPLPALAPEWTGCKVTAFLLDSEVGTVMNAARIEAGAQSRVETLPSVSGNAPSVTWGGGCVNLSSPEPIGVYTLTVFDMQGKALMRTSGCGSDRESVPVNHVGPMILLLTTEAGAVSAKVTGR